MPNIDRLVAEARRAISLSYSPYSKFPVSAAVKTANEQIYSGCNIENASYGLTLCAEAVAISHMIMGGEDKILEMVVMGKGELSCTPCGACRQRIREFAAAETKIHICNFETGLCKTMTLEELLPASFGPENLRP